MTTMNNHERNYSCLREDGEEQHHGRVVEGIRREPGGQALNAAAFLLEEVEDEAFACRRGVRKQ